MSIEFTSTRSTDDVLEQVRHLGDDMGRAMRHTWFAIGDDFIKRAQKEIKRKPKSGRVYMIRISSKKQRKYGLSTRTRHVASAPGETHANRSGDLMDSLGYKVRGSDSVELGYGVGEPRVDYDVFVEDGTKRMKPRPSVELALKYIIANGEGHFQRAMAKQLKGTDK